MALPDILPKQASPSPAQQAAADMDRRLVQLAHACIGAVRALDTRRLYHDATELRGAIWPELTSGEVDSLLALEPTLRDYAGELLPTEDADRLAETAQRLGGMEQPLERARLVLGVLDARDRETDRGNVVPTEVEQMVADVRALALHNQRSIDDDGTTIRRAVEKVLTEGLAVAEHGVRLGKRYGWSNVEPKMSEVGRWDTVRSFVSTHLPDHDPGAPPADPETTTE